MKIKLKEKEADGTISVYEMKDGQVGVITAWPGGHYINRIVQRYCNDLITIGGDGGEAWSLFFDGTHYNGRRVRLLKAGELLEVVGE